MEDIAEANAFEVMVLGNPKAVIANGFRDDEPIFNVALMAGLAEDKLLELQSLRSFDLTVEKERKAKEKAIRAIKKSFTDFDSNMKVIKDTFMPIPKKCDAVRKAVKDRSDAAFAKAFEELGEIEAQTELVYSTWQEELWGKKSTIPHDAYSIGLLLVRTEEAEPCRHSSPKELEDFKELKAAYAAKVKSVLEEKRAAEKARSEELERQAKEAVRLAEERMALEAERRKQAAEAARAAAEQRREQEALEAERAAFERQKQQQAAGCALPPPLPSMSEAKHAIAGILSQSGMPAAASIRAAEAISKAIGEGRIPGVKFACGTEGRE
jgi:hypothetical protein